MLRLRLLPVVQLLHTMSMTGMALNLILELYLLLLIGLHCFAQMGEAEGSPSDIGRASRKVLFACLRTDTVSHGMCNIQPLYKIKSAGSIQFVK